MSERKRAVLEVIALGVEDAVAAQAGGADRLELVTDMAADGLTPAVETFVGIRAAVDISLRVMLRRADGFAAGGAKDVDALVRLAGRCGPPERTSSCSVSSTSTAVPTCPPWSGSSRNWTAALDVPPRDRPRRRPRLLRKQLADLPGLDAYLTAGSPDGVDDGFPTLLAEAARRTEPGYEPRIMVGGGLRLDHVPRLRAARIDAFHIGGAARPGGWDGPVAVAAVREWRQALDA